MVGRSRRPGAVIGVRYGEWPGRGQVLGNGAAAHLENDEDYRWWPSRQFACGSHWCWPKPDCGPDDFRRGRLAPGTPHDHLQAWPGRKFGGFAPHTGAVRRLSLGVPRPCRRVWSWASCTAV